MRTWTFPEVHPAVEGPWADEPDKAQWVDEATGLDCLIVRQGRGALCGYVGVPPEAPLHGKDYDTLDVYVHGGLTFAHSCQDAGGDRGICHVPEPGRPEHVWWFGFHCAHWWDLTPRDVQVAIDRPYYPWAPVDAEAVYRRFSYVQSEVTDLARQLAAVGVQS